MQTKNERKVFRQVRRRQSVETLFKIMQISHHHTNEMTPCAADRRMLFLTFRSYALTKLCIQFSSFPQQIIPLYFLWGFFSFLCTFFYIHFQKYFAFIRLSSVVCSLSFTLLSSVDGDFFLLIYTQIFIPLICIFFEFHCYYKTFHLVAKEFLR